MNSKQTFKTGTAVRHTDGRLGIISDDDIRKSGPNKGKLGVNFIVTSGPSYLSFAYCRLSELTIITLVEATTTEITA